MNGQIKKCWAFARVNLPGVSEGDFWRLTPREYNILAEEWASQSTETSRRTAALCASIYNASGNFDRTFTVEDFIRGPSDGEPDLDAAFSILAQLKQ